MIDDDQLGAVEVDHLLELVDHAQLPGPVPRRQTRAGNLDVLVRVRDAPATRLLQVADRAAPEEVGDESHGGAVPGVEDRAGGPLPVELRDRLLPAHGNVDLVLEDTPRPHQPHVVEMVTGAEAHVNGKP